MYGPWSLGCALKGGNNIPKLGFQNFEELLSTANAHSAMSLVTSSSKIRSTVFGWGWGKRLGDYGTKKRQWARCPQTPWSSTQWCGPVFVLRVGNTEIQDVAWPPYGLWLSPHHTPSFWTTKMGVWNNLDMPRVIEDSIDIQNIEHFIRAPGVGCKSRWGVIQRPCGRHIELMKCYNPTKGNKKRLIDMKTIGGTFIF